eukprot:1322181-Amorphochlora_amoeboformis.AAC.1
MEGENAVRGERGGVVRSGFSVQWGWRFVDICDVWISWVIGVCRERVGGLVTCRCGRVVRMVGDEVEFLVYRRDREMGE